MTRRLLVALVLLVAPLAASVPRAAAASFLAPTTVSSPRDPFESVVSAADGRGGAIVAWGHSLVRAATLAPGSTAFSAPQTMHQPAAYSTALELAANHDGAAALTWVWRSTLTGPDRLDVATRQPGNGFGRPLELYTDPARTPASAVSPRVAIDDRGTVTVVWVAEDAAARSARVEASVRRPGGAFSRPVVLSFGGERASHPDVAVDGAGGVTVAWTSLSGGQMQVRETQRPPGGAFSAPVTVQSTSDDLGPISLAVDQGSEAVMAWRDGSGANARILAATRSAGQLAFGLTAPVSSEGERIAGNPSVAIDSTGAAVAAWSRVTGMRAAPAAPRASSRQPIVEVHAALGSAAGSFGPGVAISPRGVGIGSPVVAFDAAHEALATWSSDTLGVATAPPGEGFMRRDVIGQSRPDLPAPQLAAGAGRQPLLVWSTTPPTDYRTQLEAAIGVDATRAPFAEVAPVLDLEGGQDLLRSRALIGQVRCSEPCALTATASVTLGASPGRVVSLPTLRRTVAPGRLERFGIRVPAAVLQALPPTDVSGYASFSATLTVTGLKTHSSRVISRGGTAPTTL